MTISETLWRDNADLAGAAMRHPFVRGLADGSLPPERFVDFIAQDAFFLESFARAYALALAHSPDRTGLEAFADLLAGVREELGLHASYAKRLGIDLTSVEPAPATLAYTDFLVATAATGGLGQTCAAMTPCMRCTTSANKTVTCLYSAGSAAADTAAPHSLQNFEFGGSSVPQAAHANPVAVIRAPPIRGPTTSTRPE